MRSVKDVKLTEKFTFNPKEGIDNPAMVLTDCTDLESTSRPRLCVLKREDGETYGFNLRMEMGCRGHVIRNVLSGGIGERSGLRDGDRLLEVNNCYIDDAPHPEVAKKIKLSGHQLCLLVLDGEYYKQAVSQGQNLQNLVRTHKEEDCKPPRLCHITKDSASGLGISFTPLEGGKGRFSVSLVRGGAAEKAGVCKGDHLVWMNGAMVSHLTHSALSRMLKKCGDAITILVIDSESEKIYMQKSMPILPAMAVPHKLPFKARKLHLISGPAGYGFLLRQEKTPSGNIHHVLREVDRDSPAERAGMKDGEILLEVNGESVESLRHEDIVDRVRLSGKQVSFTAITPSGLDFYTKLGLSPLLFCEDDAAEKKKDENIPAFANGQSFSKENKDSCSMRLYTVQKDPQGFGFNLNHDPQRPGILISEVASGGTAQKAGLVVGDIVLEINGQNVEEKRLEDVIELLEKEKSLLSLLVKNQTIYNKLKETETAISDVSDREEEDDYEISFF